MSREEKFWWSCEGSRGEFTAVASAKRGVRGGLSERLEADDGVRDRVSTFTNFAVSSRVIGAGGGDLYAWGEMESFGWDEPDVGILGLLVRGKERGRHDVLGVSDGFDARTTTDSRNSAVESSSGLGGRR
jgi:hypothetical protein